MLRVAALVAVLVGTTQVAYAYVLPADFLMKLLAEKRLRLGVKDLAAQLSSELADRDATVDERLYIKTPERLRLVTQGEDEATVSIEREGQYAQGLESTPARVPGTATDLLARLLFPAGKDLDESSARMLAAMKAAGVLVSTVSLGRDGDAMVYIIGAKSYEPDKPQVWISKATYLPVRTLLFDTSKNPPERHEMRFRDYGGAVSGDYLPGVIEHWVNGKRQRRAELLKVSINPNLPESMFELPKK